MWKRHYSILIWKSRCVIELIEGIVDLGIISEYFLKEYFIFLGKSIDRNVDASLLCLRLSAKDLVNECNIKVSRQNHAFSLGKMKKGSWNS